MASLNDLRNSVAEALAEEKAYNLPSVCADLGLASGDESEAFSSKRSYVLKRLAGMSKERLIELASKVSAEYSSADLHRILGEFTSDTYQVALDNRKNIIDTLILLEENERLYIHGKLNLVEFLNRVWQLDHMPSTDLRYDTAARDIYQHMVNNNDWNYQYLFGDYLNLMSGPDEQFLRFLEELVHPIVRSPSEQGRYAATINEHLIKDGFLLDAREQISGYPVYRIVGTGTGVEGKVKNLIFAADGPKPKIVLADAVSNDIQIVENAEYCLVYSLDLPQTGLRWTDMVGWWATLNGTKPSLEIERSLYQRLLRSLDSKPEKTVFHTYYEKFRDAYQDKLPALIPQVYLHYDPYTIRELGGIPRLGRQRMDFLILFSNYDRIVIEVDGKHHYSVGNTASPQKYSEMVAEDRKLRLAGYELYRFGAFELQGKSGKELVEQFFRKLLRKYRLA